MLYHLLYPLHEQFAVFNVFRYITFRTGGATVTAILFILIMWISTRPLQQDSYDESAARPLTATQQVFAEAEGFSEVQDIIGGRCSMCHAREPGYDGIHRAPKNVLLETTQDITAHAREIFLQAGASTAMPPANVSFMEEAERASVVRWYRAAAKNLPFTLAAN